MRKQRGAVIPILGKSLRSLEFEMKLIICLVTVMLMSGCGRLQDHPKYANGETVWYDVNGVTGTGFVVESFHYKDGWYYQVDVEVDSAGERDRPYLHEKLLSRKK